MREQYLRRILLDLLIVPLAFYLAWLIRFDGHVPAQEWRMLTVRLLPIAVLYIFANLVLGIYRRMWAYASFRDVIDLCETVGLGTLVLLVVNFALTSLYGHRLSTGGLIMGGFFTLVFSTTAKYRRHLLNVFMASWRQSADSDPERILIVGVSEAAQQLATRMYLGKSPGNYRLVGFVDWGSEGAGMSVNGVPVLGTPDQIGTLVRQNEIDIVVIASRPTDREEMWRLVSACRETTAQVKILPDIDQVLTGRYEDPLALRDVGLEDILDRPMATIDVEACERLLANKVVLVTGAAGSIGSELCRQILRFRPRSLLALDNNETGLYELDLELQRHGPTPLQLIMADVTDRRKVTRVFRQFRPQIVFHAAAYKHVPLLETCVDEALRVNVMGTIIVSEAAREYQAERLVFISTDKAVNPCSVMGASKRIGELWIRAVSRGSDTVFTSVRFGNVMGSRGSVVPTFAQQIEMGGPVTVTHPDMARFFMSIPEAVSLVLQAAALATGNEIFMLEMGDEVSIMELARRMIRLRGLRVNKDIEVT
ncbi:MAG: nucleoside-diphosphate sugar epimerase/dehydratase, partial [Anaerolineae bacterium]